MGAYWIKRDSASSERLSAIIDFMYCRHCSEQLTVGANFCTGCGQATRILLPRKTPQPGDTAKMVFIGCAVAGGAILVAIFILMTMIPMA